MRRVWIVVGALLAVLAVGLIGSTSAQAVGQKQYFANAVGWISAAKAAGAATFPEVAKRCPGGVKVAPVVEERDPAKKDWGAWSYTDRTGCHIRFNFRPGLPAPVDYPSFCALTVHEYGHLGTGDVRHSSDPNSVMHHPVFVVPPACGSGRTQSERITAD